METRCGVTLMANMVSNKRFRPLVPKLSLTHASHILNASNSNSNSISISSPSICSIANDAAQQENPNIHKNKSSLTTSGSHGEKCLLESCKIEGQAQPSSGTRWNPTAEQIKMLETLYKGGMRTPNAHQIEKITTQLKIYGKIEGKNVFYWFQNHKARERQKQKRSVQPPQASDSPSPSPTPAQTMPVREATDHREADVNCFLSNFLFLANSKLSPNSSPRMVDSTSSKGSSLDPDVNLDEQTDANAKHTSYKRKSRSWPLKEESNLHLNWEQRSESDHLREVPRVSDGVGEVYTLELFPLHPEGLQLQAIQSRLSPHLQCSRWCDSPTMFAHYTDPSSKL